MKPSPLTLEITILSHCIIDKILGQQNWYLFYYSQKIVCNTKQNNIFLLIRTGSNPADINRFRRLAILENYIPTHYCVHMYKYVLILLIEDMYITFI